MIIFGSIIAYLIIPFIMFGLSDWMSGYYSDRLKRDIEIYDEDDFMVILFHMFWPLMFPFLVFAWTYAIYKSIDKKYSMGGLFFKR